MLTVHGEHDIATRPSLQDELHRVGATGERIVVDLSPASFLDSSIVRALAAAAHGDDPMRDRLAVVAPQGTFAGRFAALVGLHRLLAVHETLAEALGGGSRR
jgi:anti-anti-sigma factor